jgi:hypothetical protein
VITAVERGRGNDGESLSERRPLGRLSLIFSLQLIEQTDASISPYCLFSRNGLNEALFRVEGLTNPLIGIWKFNNVKTHW